MSIFDDNGPRGQFIPGSEVSQDDIERLMGGEHHPVTSEYHSVWYALGKGHICIAVPQIDLVFVRDEDGIHGALGVIYQVRSAIWPNPEAVSDEDRDALVTATASFLQTMGAEVERDGESTRLKIRFPGGRLIDVNADPFNGAVDEFLADMEKALGPSAVKDDPDDPMARWRP